MINVYPSKLEGEPIESHEHANTTVLEWLQAAIPNFEESAGRVGASVNGLELEALDYPIVPGDDVRIYPVPKNDTFNLFFNPAFHSKIGIMKYLMPKVSTPKTPQQRRGSDLQEVTVSGNEAKLNGVIREIAGRHRVYPDYLVPAHRYFGTPREQYVDLLLCVGKGKYSIPASQVKVGDTPIISLGSDAEYKIYQPGESLASDAAANWWHSAPEVGSSSTGAAGLELKATYAVAPNPEAGAYNFTADVVSIPQGAGQFPQGWAAGMIARIIAPQTYTVIDDPAGDIIQGDHSALGPFEGMKVEIVGANEGRYEIASVPSPDQLTLRYPGGGAVTGLTPSASSLMAIGYAGLRYRLTAAGDSAISVLRLTDSGQEDDDWAGWPSYTTAQGRVSLDGSSQEGDWIGPFAACPEGELTSQIEWDVMFPSGLTRISSNDGGLREISVKTELQYRDQSTAGAWTSVPKTYTGKLLDAVGYTEVSALPYAMRPEVRMRRIGAKSTDTNTQDTVQWYGLRAQLPIKKSYEGVTVMTARIRGGERLSNQSDQLINVVATRVLPVRSGNGTWDVETPTRDILPWVAHVARSIGYVDSELDLAELDALQSKWFGADQKFDRVYESAATARDVINNAFKAGYSELTLDRGRITAVRDEPRGVPEQMFTPQNMTKAMTRSVDAIQPDNYDGVDVEYVDARTWQLETVQCRLPGDEGRKVEKIQGEGVTDRTQAYRMGMRRRRELKYRRWAYQWGTELDALNTRYLSFVAAADDVPGYAHSAILTDYMSGNGLHLLHSSEPLPWGDAGQYVIALRRPDGTLSGPWPATRVDDWRITVPELDFVPVVGDAEEPPHLLFGPLNRWCYPALITDVKPSGTTSVSVSAVNYDERVYADDASYPPIS